MYFLKHVFPMYHSFDRINKSQIKFFFNKVFLFKTPAFNLACTKDPKDASYISSLFVCFYVQYIGIH